MRQASTVCCRQSVMLHDRSRQLFLTAWIILVYTAGKPRRKKKDETRSRRPCDYRREKWRLPIKTNFGALVWHSWSFYHFLVFTMRQSKNLNVFVFLFTRSWHLQKWKKWSKDGSESFDFFCDVNILLFWKQTFLHFSWILNMSENSRLRKIMFLRF